VFAVDFNLGMSSQDTAVATNRPTRIGCRTLTPTWLARIPVTMGKTDPPICPVTNTTARAVEWISGGNNFEPTDTPCRRS
jgi:hypothetical protein